jgi:hypothetical protein
MSRPEPPVVHGIVPPYLLGHLAGTDHPQSSAAQATLLRDSRQRRRRAQGAARTSAARTGGAAPGGAATAQGLRRTISDAGHVERMPGRAVRKEGQDPTGDAAVDEAYDGFGATWSLYHDVYGRSSIDDAGLPLLGTVHYGEHYENAFWNGSRMVFGDGDGEIFGRFTASLDVIGHELTHGVVQSTAGLVYADQPGALNESMADVFGIMVKQRALGQTAAESDWMVGADLLLPGIDGAGLRSMLDPGTAYDDPRLGKDPQPGHMRDYIKTRDDSGGVHYNSGIPNRAFALAATGIGGQAWEGAGRIWYAALTSDVIPATCDFATFAALTVAAAETIHGAGSDEASTVRDAWTTVGVEIGSVPTSAPVPSGVAPHAEVVVRRTGGFAGTTKERRSPLADLDEHDRSAWQGLLAGRLLTALATVAATRPDGFVYDVRCVDVDLDLAVPEPALPPDVKGLFERFLSD